MRTRYELITYWSKDDDCFVVEVPELPGCMADGRSVSPFQRFSDVLAKTFGVQRINVLLREISKILFPDNPVNVPVIK